MSLQTKAVRALETRSRWSVIEEGHTKRAWWKDLWLGLRLTWVQILTWIYSPGDLRLVI